VILLDDVIFLWCDFQHSYIL